MPIDREPKELGLSWHELKAIAWLLAGPTAELYDEGADLRVRYFDFNTPNTRSDQPEWLARRKFGERGER